MPLFFELHSNFAETQGPCPSYSPNTQTQCDRLAKSRMALLFVFFAILLMTLGLKTHRLAGHPDSVVKKTILSCAVPVCWRFLWVL